MDHQNKNKKIENESLVDAYRTLMGIPGDRILTRELVFHHWELEKDLARCLKNSNPSNRWKTAKNCYTIFYQKLPWLNESVDSIESRSPDCTIIRLVGTAPKKVFEIGSGSGVLIHSLSRLGHRCRGCDITPERGYKRAYRHPNLTFGVNDGIHLDRFEPWNHYDTVISSNVIEHLHPDDLEQHFQSALRILKPGGRYILKTPHHLYGPHGIESIFGLKELQGFHLKEYTISEIHAISKCCGYRSSEVVFSFQMPSLLNKALHTQSPAWPSVGYKKYLIWMENILMSIARPDLRKKIAEIARFFLFPRQVFMVLHK